MSVRIATVPHTQTPKSARVELASEMRPLKYWRQIQTKRPREKWREVALRNNVPEAVPERHWRLVLPEKRRDAALANSFR